MQRGIALFGHNISYSLSPVIHNTAFKIAQLPFTYLTVDIEPERFDKALEAVQTLNFAGANVTIPYKETVLKYTTALSESAQKIGAVNTLHLKDGTIFGDNTDSDGFYNAYMNELHLLKNGTVLIIGAGGAARAVCDTLIRKITPHRIVIANRHAERSRPLLAHLKHAYGYDSVHWISISDPGLEKTAGEASGIIQTTPVGSGTYAEESPVSDSFRFTKNHIVIDLIYNPVETVFLRNAAQSGARTRNGVSMLLHQAALSFKLWTGTTFPMDDVIPIVMENIKR
jgi:shikimate dehydrogenase